MSAVTSPDRSWRGRVAIWRWSASGCWPAPCWSAGVSPSTADIGRVVFTLVDEELLATQATDRETDFAGVFEFPVAFDESYTVRWSGQ